MMDESKISSFLFLMLIKERGGGAEFRIFLCQSKGGSFTSDFLKRGGII